MDVEGNHKAHVDRWAITNIRANGRPWGQDERSSRWSDVLFIASYTHYFNFNSLWSISLVHIQTVIFFKDMAPLFSADCQLVGFHTHKNVDLILATSMLQSGILEVWVKRCSTVSTDLHKYDPLYKMWK